jgi:methanogenic corrinoid protein MtbC1
LTIYLSPKELALVIDASESSIKRWVDKGGIQADISDGGHRHIRVEHAVDYIRQNRLTVKRADLLGFPDVNALMNDGDIHAIDPLKFMGFLTNGDAKKARGYILKLYLQGFEIPEICDLAIEPAMEQIGELWQHDESGISIEHHATDICIQAVTALRMIFHSQKNAPVALGCALEGDPYLIPTLCVSTVLLSEGYNAINLGPDTPVRSLESAVVMHNPLIVWFSVTSKLLPKNIHKVLEAYVQYLSAKKIRVFIGGQNSSAVQNLNAPNIFYGNNMTEMAAFLKGMKNAAITVSQS